MSDNEQERLSEETIHTILQATVGWEANSFAGKVHRIINQLRADLELWQRNYKNARSHAEIHAEHELRAVKMELEALQARIDMYELRDREQQPCAECEAYYALQARIDSAPEYWAHFTPCSHVSIFRDAPRLSKEKSAIWEPGCRDVRVKLLESDPPTPEQEKE